MKKISNCYWITGRIRLIWYLYYFFPMDIILTKQHLKHYYIRNIEVRVSIKIMKYLWLKDQTNLRQPLKHILEQYFFSETLNEINKGRVKHYKIQNHWFSLVVLSTKKSQFCPSHNLSHTLRVRTDFS